MVPALSRDRVAAQVCLGSPAKAPSCSLRLETQMCVAHSTADDAPSRVANHNDMARDKLRM
jgi:hypothetical protein